MFHLFCARASCKGANGSLCFALKAQGSLNHKFSNPAKDILCGVSLCFDENPPWCILKQFWRSNYGIGRTQIDTSGRNTRGARGGGYTRTHHLGIGVCFGHVFGIPTAFRSHGYVQFAIGGAVALCVLVVGQQFAQAICP